MARNKSKDEPMSKTLEIQSKAPGTVLLGRKGRGPLAIQPGSTVVSEDDWNAVKDGESAKGLIESGTLRAVIPA